MLLHPRQPVDIDYAEVETNRGSIWLVTRERLQTDSKHFSISLRLRGMVGVIMHQLGYAVKWRSKRAEWVVPVLRQLHQLH